MAKLGGTPYNHHKHMPSKVVGKPITVAKIAHPVVIIINSTVVL